MAQKPSNTLKIILSRPNDTINIEERGDVINKTPWNNCDMCYIGEPLITAR